MSDTDVRVLLNRDMALFALNKLIDALCSRSMSANLFLVGGTAIAVGYDSLGAGDHSESYS